MFDKKALEKEMSSSNEDQNFKNLVTYLRNQKKSLDLYQSNIDTVMEAVEKAKNATELRSIYVKYGIVFS